MIDTVNKSEQPRDWAEDLAVAGTIEGAIVGDWFTVVGGVEATAVG